MKRLFVLTAVALATVAGCATAELEPTATGVRVISQQEARSCKFVDAISANNQNTLSKNPELDARNRAMNRIAAAGGNALVIKTTSFTPSSSGLGGVFALSGEAYRCP